MTKLCANVLAYQSIKKYIVTVWLPNKNNNYGVPTKEVSATFRGHVPVKDLDLLVDSLNALQL